MVFATREEEIEYLRDELERAGYDEASNQKWDEATLGRARKLKLLEEEAPRRRRADVYDESGSDEEESDEEAEEVDEQGICWSGARGPDMEEEEAEAPARRRCAHVKEDGRQCPNFVIGNNEKCKSVHKSNSRDAPDSLIALRTGATSTRRASAAPPARPPPRRAPRPLRPRWRPRLWNASGRAPSPTSGPGSPPRGGRRRE